MKVLLLSYFYEPMPMPNPAAERWSDLVQALEAQGLDITVVTGPWKKNQPGQKIRYLPDPVSRDARWMKNTAGPSQRKAGGGRAFFKSLFLDGKFFWSWIATLYAIGLRIRHGRFDWLVVSGTPWSSFPLAALASKLVADRLALDFRDLWAGSESTLSKCLGRADLVITVNQPLADFFRNGSPRTPQLVMGNSFRGKIDWTPSEFARLRGREKIVYYCGTVSAYHGLDDFLRLWPAKEGPRLVFRGSDPQNILASFPVEHRPPIVRSACEDELRNAAVLLLVLHSSSVHFTTGKLVTYIKAGRPILYYGPPDSPAANLIRSHNLGWVVPNGKRDALVEASREIQRSFTLENDLPFQPDPNFFDSFSNENTGAKLASCLKNPPLPCPSST